jgi:hypothetical protein
MDPVTAASVIAGLIGFGLQISTGLFQLYSAIKDASVDLRRIEQDTQALCGML